MVCENSRRIARDTSESAYIRDREGGGKTERVGIRNSVEYI